VEKPGRGLHGEPMSATTTAVRTSACRICGGPLPAKPATGRPPVFCGEVCRRESEFALRRIVRRLGKLEDLSSDARIEAAMHGGVGSIAEFQMVRLAAFEDEAERLSARLREMLA
jgi:hypothetical protein